MKTIFSFLLVINFLHTGLLYSQVKKLETIKNISALEFVKISESDPTSVIIDVRTKKEYKKGHIINSLNAEDSQALTKLTANLDFDQPLLIYCDEGTRSITACTILKEKGFVTVYNLETGLLEWEKSGYMLTKK